MQSNQNGALPADNYSTFNDFEFDPTTHYRSSPSQLTDWPPEGIHTHHSNHFTPLISYPDTVDMQRGPTFGDTTQGFDLEGFDMFDQPRNEAPAAEEEMMMVDQWDQQNFCNSILDSFMDHN